MDKLNVTKFNGQDFTVWKFQTERFLDGHELFDVVNGTKQKPATNSDDWVKKDKKAQMVICNAIDTAQIRNIMNCKTSAAMWTRLETLYEQKNATNVHIKMQKFFEYKMETSDSIANHVAKIETMASELEDLGNGQTAMAIVTKVLHSLPKSYRHVIAAWDAVAEDKRTMEELVPRLLKEESLDKVWDKDATEDTAALFHRSGQHQPAQAFQSPVQQKPNHFK